MGLSRFWRSTPAPRVVNVNQDLYCPQCDTTIPDGIIPTTKNPQSAFKACVLAYYETKDLRKRGWSEDAIKNHLNPSEATHVPLPDGGEVLLWEVGLILAREAAIGIRGMPPSPAA